MSIFQGWLISVFMVKNVCTLYYNTLQAIRDSDKVTWVSK